MFSDAGSAVKAKEKFEAGGGLCGEKPVYEKWRDWQPSVISHHGAICCEIARDWITATDFSELGGRSIFTGPRWLRQRFNWGCSTFPIYWCEAVRRKTLDCGAFAAMTHEIFNARGIKNYRAQMMQKFSLDATGQWTANWTEENATASWIEKDLVYHEGAAIISEDNKVRVWDSSAGWWIEPQMKKGYGALLAVRLSLPFSRSRAKFVWGKHGIAENCWQIID